MINIALYVILSTYYGLVGSKLWLWFVVPFFGMSPLSVPHVMGLCLLITVFGSGTNYIPVLDIMKKSDQQTLEDTLKIFAFYFLRVSFLFLVGFILSYLV